jgi:hypothetical protein
MCPPRVSAVCVCCLPGWACGKRLSEATHTHTHKHRNSLPPPHTNMHARTHTYTHTHTRTRTHTRTHTHTHTHTRTHTCTLTASKAHIARSLSRRVLQWISGRSSTTGNSIPTATLPWADSRRNLCLLLPILPTCDPAHSLSPTASLRRRITLASGLATALQSHVAPHSRPC